MNWRMRLLGAWLTGVTLIAAGGAARARQPNVVIIMADDLGYADLGCQGSRDIKTPNIDGLASHGVRCTNGYADGPRWRANPGCALDGTLSSAFRARIQSAARSQGRVRTCR